MGRDGFPTSDSLHGSTQSGESSSALAVASPALVPALTILYHREPRRIGERALLLALPAGRAAELSRLTPLFARAGEPAEGGQPLGDPRISRQPLRIFGDSAGGLRLLVDNPGSRVRYRGTPVAGSVSISADELRDGGVLELGSSIALVLHLSQPVAPTQESEMAMHGESHLIHAVRAHIRRLARIDAPVLIRGESGTGKELAAQALHALSARAAQPLVAVNLGALPPSIAAAELFGAERGAFTGATARQPGYFQQARGGTLFLDEIGEAPLEVQALLLRVIETGEIRPLGAGAPLKLQARIIAATDADLEAMLSERAFRLPLLHRLATCELRLPALRQRREDIGPLVLHFLRLECAAQRCPFLLDRPGAETAPWLPLHVLCRLAAYDWPGNVRELRNIVRQMMLFGEDQLSLALPPGFAGEAAAPAGPRPAPPAARAAPAQRRRPADISEEELLNALEQNRWDLKATAAALDIAR
ncbi:MAG TPA: sigma 54-interacting transcriptional regulator, partial [Pseudomonadota bacterium]|nr:sigma 54-interacting transcriptional regulator [Pseudomonadota bacterium]